MATILFYSAISMCIASLVRSNSHIVRGLIGFTWPLALYLKAGGGYDSYKAFLEITVARVIK